MSSPSPSSSFPLRSSSSFSLRSPLSSFRQSGRFSPFSKKTPIVTIPQFERESEGESSQKSGGLFNRSIRQIPQTQTKTGPAITLFGGPSTRPPSTTSTNEQKAITPRGALERDILDKINGVKGSYHTEDVLKDLWRYLGTEKRSCRLMLLRAPTQKGHGEALSESKNSLSSLGIWKKCVQFLTKLNQYLTPNKELSSELETFLLQPLQHPSSGTFTWEALKERLSEISDQIKRPLLSLLAGLHQDIAFQCFAYIKQLKGQREEWSSDAYHMVSLDSCHQTAYWVQGLPGERHLEVHHQFVFGIGPRTDSPQTFKPDATITVRVTLQHNGEYWDTLTIEPSTKSRQSTPKAFNLASEFQELLNLNRSLDPSTASTPRSPLGLSLV